MENGNGIRDRKRGNPSRSTRGLLMIWTSSEKHDLCNSLIDTRQTTRMMAGHCVLARARLRMKVARYASECLAEVIRIVRKTSESCATAQPPVAKHLRRYCRSLFKGSDIGLGSAQEGSYGATGSSPAACIDLWHLWRRGKPLYRSMPPSTSIRQEER